MSVGGPAHVLAVSTTSMGKLGEIAALVRRVKLPVPLRLLTTVETAPDLVVIEDGTTFTENAIKKARALARRTRMLVLADDSGLEVDLLGGAPGLHSARYAGTDGRAGTDEANRVKLIEELTQREAWSASGDDDPSQQVKARFRCVLAVIDPLGASEEDGGTVLTAEGTCEGYIVREARGQRGFGYDPVFVPAAKEATGRTMAELGFEEKLGISHRGRAFEALVPALGKLLEARKKALDVLLGGSAGAG
jgi:XTP/dITP diphosphohydrolase